MKHDFKRPAGILARIGLGGIAGLMVLTMLFLFVGSLLGTTNMTILRDEEGKIINDEAVLFEEDSLWLNLLFLVLFVAVGIGLVLLLRKLGILQRLTVPRLSWGLGIWVAVFGSLWVLMSMSSPTHDSLIVTRAGVAMALGNDEYITADYFIRFPFQLGYVLWTELWARLFMLTHKSYLLIEFVNVACLAAGEMALVRLSDRLFGNRTVTVATMVALALFVQPMIFCAFLYGTMPGLCFALWSMLLFVRYLQTDKWGYIIGASALLAVSVGLKLNNMILLVAMAILLLLHFLRRLDWRRLAAVAILCAMVLTLKNVGVWQYELRTERDFGDGIPMVSWMAMGLNEGNAAPGWFNATYTVVNFNNAGKDPDVASEASVAEIKERIEYFTENPAESAEFFSKKILSQWNEPTYQSIWNNQVRGQYMEKFGYAAYVCGEGEEVSKAAMDLGIQWIFFGMLISTVVLLISQIRRKDDRRPDEVALWLIPLTILGGFLYHLLFEAKSQYIITYMVYMIPFAVWGCAEVIRAGRRGIGILRSKKSAE